MGNFTQGILNAHLDHFFIQFFWALELLQRSTKKKSKNSKKCMVIKMLIAKNY